MEEMPVLSEEPETNEAEVVEAPLEVLLDAYIRSMGLVYKFPMDMVDLYGKCR